jgi:hypothetical protein
VPYRQYGVGGRLTAQRYIKEFKDADIIQYDGHDQYTNPNAKNPQ